MPFAWDDPIGDIGQRLDFPKATIFLRCSRPIAGFDDRPVISIEAAANTNISFTVWDAMGLKLPPPDLELYQRVGEVLHYVWDPIGVQRFPTARDEYHGYLDQVFSLIKQGISEEELAAFLGRITFERMGLELRPEHDMEVARLLLEWRQTISEKFARLA